MQISESWSCDLREPCFSCEYQSHVSVFSRKLFGLSVCSSSSEVHWCYIILLRAPKITDSLIWTERVGKRGICRSLKDRAALYTTDVLQSSTSVEKRCLQNSPRVSRRRVASPPPPFQPGPLGRWEKSGPVGSYCLECVCAAAVFREG